MPPGKFNQLLPRHIQTFSENWNKIHALVFDEGAKKVFFGV